MRASVQQTLKDRLKELIPAKKEEVAAFRKEHGKFSLGHVTIDQVRPVLSLELCPLAIVCRVVSCLTPVARRRRTPACVTSTAS